MKYIAKHVQRKIHILHLLSSSLFSMKATKRLLDATRYILFLILIGTLEVEAMSTLAKRLLRDISPSRELAIALEDADLEYGNWIWLKVLSM